MKIDSFVKDMDALRLYHDIYPDPLPPGYVDWIADVVYGTDDFDREQIAYVCVVDRFLHEARLTYLPTGAITVYQTFDYNDAVLWAADMRFWIKFYDQLNTERIGKR